MIIAGCLNQAKRIIAKFDKVIDGKTPEYLVEETHEKIRALLRSQELSQVLDEDDGESEAAVASSDDFIRKIVEAVAPILPITLRDKSLDSGYFRAAHQCCWQRVTFFSLIMRRMSESSLILQALQECARPCMLKLRGRRCIRRN